jgi:hypothetical protein
MLRRSLIENSHNVVDPSLTTDAVLSHSSPQQLEQLLTTDSVPDDQAHYHDHIRQQRRTRHDLFIEHHAIQTQRLNWLTARLTTRLITRLVACATRKNVHWRWNIRCQIHDYGRLIRLRVDSRVTCDNAQATFSVENLFLSLGRIRLTVRSGSLTRSLSAQMVAATEWAE